MRLGTLSLIASVCLVAGCGTTGGDDANQNAQSAALTTSDPRALIPVEPDPLATPGSPQEFLEIVGDRVYFQVDRYDLTEAARVTLERQAQWLQRYPSRSIVIEGHADERGTREYNLALGDRRANAVRNFLVAVGIDPNRVATVSYGKEQPIATGPSETSWAQNRRGVTVVD